MNEIARKTPVVADCRLLALLALLAMAAPQAVWAAEPVAGSARPTVEVARWGRQLTLDYQPPRVGSRNRSARNGGGPPQFSVFRDGREIGSGTFRYG